MEQNEDKSAHSEENQQEVADHHNGETLLQPDENASAQDGEKTKKPPECNDNRAPIVSGWTKFLSFSQVFFGAGLLGAAVAQIFVYRHQTKIMSSELQETRLDDRAWIDPASAGVTKERNGRFRLLLKFGNVGKEPALNVQFFGTALTYSITKTAGTAVALEARREIIHYTRGCSLDRMPMTRVGVLYPSGAKSHNFESNMPANFVSKDERSITVGCFLYSTQRKWHYSTFCFYWDPSNMRPVNKWSICKIGNSSD